METTLLIDGENFKGKIKSVFKTAQKDTPIWHEYDFKGLLDKVLNGIQVDKKRFYFAKLKMHQDSPEKSKELIQEQRSLKTHLEKNGFEVILAGSVMPQQRESGKRKVVFKEKGVDVRIAVDMMAYACDKKSETIILGSSDSDLQPAIKEIRNRSVGCLYLGFEVNPNKGISYTTERTILIRDSEVFEFEKIQKTLT